MWNVSQKFAVNTQTFHFLAFQGIGILCHNFCDIKGSLEMCKNLKFIHFLQTFFFIHDQANDSLKSEFWQSFLSQPPTKQINWRHLNVNKRGVSVNNSALVQRHLVNYMFCWSTCGVMVKCCCVNRPWQFYIYWNRCLLNTLQPSTDHRSIFQCNISQ